MALTPVFRRRFVALVSTCFGVVSGCALNWDVRSDSADASPTADTFVPSDGNPTDSPSSTDGSPDSTSADCTALAAAVESAREAAKACSVPGPGQCSATSNDACACPVVVNSQNAAAKGKYESAVATYLASCAPDCSSGCKNVGLPGGWACLEENGNDFVCTP